MSLALNNSRKIDIYLNNNKKKITIRFNEVLRNVSDQFEGLGNFHISLRTVEISDLI